MTLFSIALRNIKRNFNSYLIYFVSMVFSIMIYYVFTSIQYNEQVVQLTEIKRTIDGAFKSSSFVIALFAGIFIWYSNSFFIKRRKKEIALYSLMGVKKREVGRMLFYENILMGIMALGVGILLGGLLSKLFVMLLVRLMGYSANIKFALLLAPILNTAIVFTVLFLITSIHGYSLIYRFKLIDLFKAENVGENEPKTSIVKAVLSLVLIGSGYVYYLSAKRFHLGLPLITLFLVVAGTYLLFSSLTIFIVKQAKKNKTSYYKGTSLVSTSQLMFRLKSHGRTLATIAVLSATTLTAMGVTSSFYYDFQTTLSSRYPFSYAYISDKKDVDKAIESVLLKYPQHQILKAEKTEFILMKGNIPNVGYQINTSGTDIHLMSESSFNRLAELRGLKERIDVKYDNEAILVDEFYNKAFLDTYEGKSLDIISGGEKRTFKIADIKAYSLLNEFMIRYVVVLDDSVYQTYIDKGKLLTSKGYIVDNDRDSEALTNELYNTIEAQGMKVGKWPLDFTAFYVRYKVELMNSGLTIFVGAFLGLVFLMATGSIIFFKQLSEANEDKKRYEVLKNVGFDNKDIKRIISKQMLFIFLLPLVVGAVHSIVAVKILGKALHIALLVPMGITIIAYTLIYMIYYLLTVNAYSKLVESSK